MWYNIERTEQRKGGGKVFDLTDFSRLSGIPHKKLGWSHFHTRVPADAWWEVKVVALWGESLQPMEDAVLWVGEGGEKVLTLSVGQQLHQSAQLVYTEVLRHCVQREQSVLLRHHMSNADLRATLVYVFILEYAYLLVREIGVNSQWN